MSTDIYAGIGSRETPADVLLTLAQIGYCMAIKGYTLRSGGACGADSAFEGGHLHARNQKHQVGRIEIYLPWKGFNSRCSGFHHISPAAYTMAAQFHPAWDRCSPAAKSLHARNCHQVMGLELDRPVSRVICWTKNASGSGGTGQALRIARHFGIRIDDLGNPALLAQYRAAIAAYPHQEHPRASL